MFKVYQYSTGKLIPSFNGKSFSSIEDAQQNIKWWFEMRRNNQSAQFVIASNDRIVKLLTVADL
ncbi:hypothetical protein [Dyadobacter sp. 3J3]|uniref:hypothetical protein n=1 Tax=Dyadobacter sp. 3J3 TaxID=2606600 RepID=UPI00135971A9|nr:hypothetical protein [Dyadobacter sp. 3J3]